MLALLIYACNYITWVIHPTQDVLSHDVLLIQLRRQAPFIWQRLRRLTAHQNLPRTREEKQQNENVKG